MGRRKLIYRCLSGTATQSCRELGSSHRGHNRQQGQNNNYFEKRKAASAILCPHVEQVLVMMPLRSPDDTRPTRSPKEEVTTLSEPLPVIRRFKLCCTIDCVV